MAILIGLRRSSSAGPTAILNENIAVLQIRISYY